jgi:hypothetical protein
MKHFKTIPIAVLLLAWITQWPLAVCAQDPQQNDIPPKPAAKALPPIAGEDDQEDVQPIPAMQPDNLPVTGFQDLTVGTAPERHSYWVPGFSYTNVISSNAQGAGANNGWYTTSFLTGNLSLLQNWSKAQLALNYSGGGSFSSNSAIGDSQFQQLGVFQTFNLWRVRLTLLDQFSYLPAAQFGFGVGTGLALPGVGGQLAPLLPSFRDGFTPNQSVFNTIGPRYSNTSGVQFNFALSPRSSVTVGGVFAILRFTEPGNIESNDVILNAGYNYQASRSDAFGISYRFSAFEYLGSPQAIGDHTVQATYGRRITGRMALKLAGGPEITTFRLPPGVPPNTEHKGIAASANLLYSFAAGGLSLSYNHGVNNGSGILLGATTDQVTLGANRRLARVWRGNVSFGYARNTNVAGTNGNQGPVYNTLYVGAGLERPLSRTADFTLNYIGNIQTSNTGTCPGATCANFTTNQIIVGLNWRTRPFVLH